jgi:sugar transferase (PEP-CTERM/EpsH1 system associated)
MAQKVGRAAMKTSVTHILYSFGIGGLENGLANLINKMDRDKFDHTVCVLSDEVSGFVKITDTPVRTFKIKRMFRHDPTLVPRLACFLRKQRPDMVRTYNWGAVEGIIAAKISGINTVIHSEHGFDMDEVVKQRARRVVARRALLRYCDMIIVPSAGLKQWLTEKVKIDGKKIEYIPNGCDTGVFFPGKAPHIREGLGISDADIVVGTVGTLKEIKGQRVLIEAFSEIRAPGLKLVIVGDGPDRKALEDMAGDMGVSNEVFFTGAVSDTAEVYRCMDMFVLPSLSENSPNCLLEAMSTALPVVASDVGDVRHITDNGAAGVIVRPRSPRELARAIQGLLGDRETAREKGIRARKRIEGHFSLGNMADGYERAYGKVLSGKEKTHPA